jgi:hypothetical protein
MATPEVGYSREAIKSELQALTQKIARIEAGEKPETGEDLQNLHSRYEQLESQLLDKAA